jgi:exo-beta-1,3-glucanase (GH17 family)
MSYREGHQYSIEDFKEPENYKHEGQDFSNFTSEDLKALWLKTLEKGMHGICFSMYEDGQEPGDTITEEQVERRIKILKPYTKWIRSFSCIEGNEFVPAMAKKHGLKTLVGAWLSDDLEKNEEEIKALIKLGKEGHVDIAAVGNEVLYRDDLPKAELLAYIKRVKDALPNIQVGYVDAYYEFTVHPDIVAATDVILTNCYPFWEGCPIEYGHQHMQQMHGQATDASQGKPVIITETGWPNKGQSVKGSVPSEEAAMQYFINATQWSQVADIPMFYFSSFDESWKTGPEGDVGAHWGLWDKNEKLKF